MTPIALQTRNQQQNNVLSTPHVFQGLSEFFPQNTSYFYSFPSGQDSGFFNGVPPWMEELVAARSLVCAGPQVNSVTFSSSLDPLIWDIMTQKFGTELIERGRAIGLSEAITNELSGPVRNILVKNSLRSSIGARQLVMAQPFLDNTLEDRYLIPSQLTVMLNDKANRNLFIPAAYIPQILKSYDSGEAFACSLETFAFPIVIKVSSSSSGDGVRICSNDAEYVQAKEQFRCMSGQIMIEEYVKSAYNLCMQFGIPADNSQPIQMLGYNEQLTSENGGFLAGIVNPYKTISAVAKVNEVLMNEILPQVRSFGWYGVGGIDVLITEDGRFFFIDANFRMTATFTFIHLQQTKKITKPVVSFAGAYQGSYDEFLNTIVPLGQNGHGKQMMSVIGLTHKDSLFRFNAGMFFDTPESITSNAKTLLDLGVQSECLKKLAMA